ncbi:ATP-dependent DNA ligase [Janibacter sp. GXQ6167]|uniref:ATP-dependent DNA ligase n=1 Tax=Janibacter sp. GXQ6167 TaxID=3240791 RepID=UPI00352394CF
MRPVKTPIELPIAPMLAKSAKTVPDPDAIDGGYSYEPKWDGFRVIVIRDRAKVELASRSGKSLTRYFPEVVEAVSQYLPEQIVLDGEIVVRRGEPDHQRLDWESLSARIHPAASRIALLARETPAEIIAFDLLALGDQSYLDAPFATRRDALEGIPLASDAPIHLTRTTGDAEVARDWFTRFEGAGLDGVIAKPLAAPYSPGKRIMVKVKHRRTAEAIVIGYRIHKSGKGVGSLLLGLIDEGGELIGVGGIAAFTGARRLELIDELEPLVIRGEDGEAVHAETDRSRFSSSKDISYVPLRPERVVEVAFDQLEGQRFRHAVTFVRWRPDRTPESCLLEQIERAPEYDLGDILT